LVSTIAPDVILWIGFLPLLKIKEEAKKEEKAYSETIV
jgi:hypothetical protein